MSKLNEHAIMEFKAAGWLDDTGAYIDEMQGAICEHVLELLTVFSNEGHSGSTAPYTIDLFQRLAMFKPIAPLTGEDWEWTEVSETMGSKCWQNKRASHVFKDEDGAYDINGRVFVDSNGVSYTNVNSHIPITFPYTPKTEYVKDYCQQ